jgi:hypothetical protein
MRTARSLSSGGYFPDLLLDMTPTLPIPRIEVSGHAGAIQEPAHRQTRLERGGPGLSQSSAVLDAVIADETDLEGFAVARHLPEGHIQLRHRHRSKSAPPTLQIPAATCNLILDVAKPDATYARTLQTSAGQDKGQSMRPRVY